MHSLFTPSTFKESSKDQSLELLAEHTQECEVLELMKTKKEVELIRLINILKESLFTSGKLIRRSFRIDENKKEVKLIRYINILKESLSKVKLHQESFLQKYPSVSKVISRHIIKRNEKLSKTFLRKC